MARPFLIVCSKLSRIKIWKSLSRTKINSPTSIHNLQTKYLLSEIYHGISEATKSPIELKILLKLSYSTIYLNQDIALKFLVYLMIISHFFAITSFKTQKHSFKNLILHNVPNSINDSTLSHSKCLNTIPFCKKISKKKNA